MALVQAEETHPQILTLTLNRANKRNALNIELLQELIQEVQKAEKNARVLILRGDGPIFCSGLDLTEASDHQLADDSEQLIAKAFKTLYFCRIPTIAKVHGAVMGGGAGLMAACDIAIAAEGCKFAFPEVKRGLVPAQVSTLLTRRLNQNILRELLLFSPEIDSRRAYEIGLVNAVVPASELQKTVLEKAKSALQGAPMALTETKELINEIYPTSFTEDLNLGLEFHHAARISPEAKEGIQAFLEKRQPSWAK